MLLNAVAIENVPLFRREREKSDEETQSKSGWKRFEEDTIPQMNSTHTHIFHWRLETIEFSLSFIQSVYV